MYNNLQPLDAVVTQAGSHSRAYENRLCASAQVNREHGPRIQRGPRGGTAAIAWTVVLWLGCWASPAHANIIFVNTSGTDGNDGLSWQQAKKTITGGLAAAVSGDQVWVAAGTYLEQITLKSGVGLYGGFAGDEPDLTQRNWVSNQTVIDGNQKGSVVTGPPGATVNTRIDGFTLRNGTRGLSCSSSSPTVSNNTIIGNNTNGGDGGGIYCTSSSSPVISSNTITGNVASYGYGGGIYCSSSSPTISNNTIALNTANRGYGGGIYCTSSSSPMISHNTIAGNAAKSSSNCCGGGIYCLASSPTITNNLIRDNTTLPSSSSLSLGAGIYCGSSCSALISGNTITGNMALLASGTASGSGGGICGWSSSSPIISGNLITGNSAGSTGGGIYCSGSSATILNNVITGNSANITGGGISCRCPATITNNSIAGNTAINGGGFECTTSPTVSNNIMALNSSGIYSTGGTPSLRNNCVYNPGGYDYSGLNPGTSDISVNPQLLAVEYGQVHLVITSPCIDAGSDGAAQPGWVDMDGQPRIQGAHVDIGADEFNGTTPAFAPTSVRVSPSGDDANDGSSWALAKRTVQAGIDAASALGGGDVWVAAGIYSERIHLGTWVHVYGGFAGTESTRSRRGAESLATVLDGGAGGSVVSIVAGGSTTGIDGFIIRNGTGTKVNNYLCGGGIYCDSACPTISNNVIMANTAGNGYGGGISCTSGFPTISNNTIVGNSAVGDGGGIHCSASRCRISNNIVAFNSSGISNASGTPALHNNCVCNPDGHDYSGLQPGTGDTSADPQLLAVGYGQVHLTASSPCIDAGDDSIVFSGTVDIDGQLRIQGIHVDIGADEFNGTTPAFTRIVIRVSGSGNDANDGSSWAKAKRTIQAGIDAASGPGGEVWVAKGTYYELTTLKPSVYLYGGFAGSETSRDQRNWLAHSTIVDGATGGSVVTALCGHRASGVDGFTIRNGSRARAGQNDFGGGIYCSNSSPAIANNTITSSDGEGIYCVNSSPEITNNAITGNNYYGIYGVNASPVILNNTIGANTSAGICMSTGLPTISNNRIIGNKGGGVRCGSAAISGNMITGNTAGSGGGISCGSATITNNTITGNSTSGTYAYGGGIYCAGSPTIANNTIVANTASGAYADGGGIYCSNVTGTISNNIVAFNSSRIFKSQAGTPLLHSNCVYNPGSYNYAALQPGTGDVSVDPRLLAEEHGQVHLTDASPCIDAGDDTVVQANWMDMDGEPRMQGTHVDMGADEYNGTTPSFTPRIIRISSSGRDDNDGLTWSSAKRTVQAGIDAVSDAGGEVWVAAGTYNERIALKLWVHVYGGFAGTENHREERNWATHATTLDGQAGGSVVSAPVGSGMCTVDGFVIRNGTSGLVLCSACLPTIANNRIMGNAASGMGISCDIGSLPRISNNTISGHGSCGVSCNLGTLFNNAVTGNSGGGICCGSATISNNTITGNSGSNGGGISCAANSSAVIRNNIVAFNSFGIYASGGTPSLSNNCVYNPLGYNYSGLSAGSGDISSDPRLLAADYGQVHLTASSPCTDAGLDGVVQPGWVDMDGEQRIQGFHVDMGADEYNGTPPRPFAPTIVRVSPSGHDANDGSSWQLAKQTVQAGIEAASPAGGEVWVAAGTYNERITLKLWTHVYGGFAGTESSRDERRWAQNVTILDGQAGGSVVSMLPGGSICTLDGFRIRNGTGNLSDGRRYGGGIYCVSSSPKISHNTITGNTLSGDQVSGSGIYCTSASPIISSNAIVGNAAGGGISCQFSSAIISNNIIVGNSANQGGGINCYGSQSSPSSCPPTIIVNNTIAGNSAATGGGICCGSPSPLLIANNLVAFNTSGIYNGWNGTPSLHNNCVFNPEGTDYSGLAAGTGDIGTDPQLLAVAYGGVHLTAGSPCIDAGLDSWVQSGPEDIDGESRIQGAHVDIGADEFNGTTPSFTPATVLVQPSGNDANDGSSWALAKRSVQAGIDAAAGSGGEVWVVAGTYSERLTLKPGVYVYGGFAGTENRRDQRSWVNNLSILDGGAGGSVVSALAGYRVSCIDGFTIRNGTGTRLGENGYGGGVYCTASPAITNNTITGNTANSTSGGSGYGGGIYCGGAASPVILNNTITKNGAGGAPNYGFGGGVYCASSSSLAILNNTIAGNGASTGGGVYYSSPSATISNNTIVGNSGGGMDCHSLSSTISNNIVAFNSSGISNSGGVPTLRNNCVYGPDGANYTGLQPGTGDISSDPQLVAAEYGELHLAAGSPCIDAGADGPEQAEAVDMDREPRIQGAHVDIGADEFNGTAPSFTPRIIRISPSGNDANDGSSWTLAMRTVQAGIDAAPRTGAEVWVAAGTYNERIALRSWAYLYGGFEGSESSRDQRSPASNRSVLDGGAGGSVVVALSGYRVSRVDGFTIRNGTGMPSATQRFGGGIYCGASPVISNNWVTGNSAQHGGGIFCSSFSPAIWNNAIAGNSADYGGGIGCLFSSAMISNNTIVTNSSAHGGGIFSGGSGSASTIANNVVAFNSSGIFITNGSLILRNNCLYNPAGQNYSGLSTGTGDICVDPRFVNGPAGDYHLTSTSPCIDTGYNAAVPTDARSDLGGQARFFNDPATSDCAFAPGTCGTAPIVDMGAYEFIPGDNDRDGDLDHDDMAALQGCASGPAVPFKAECAGMDLDRDGDVDQADFGIFQRCYSGVDRPVDSGCVK